MSGTESFDVIGLGQCSFDILGRLPRFPDVDQKAELDELKFEGGGPVATALVALSRFQVPVAFCGSVGDDEYGGNIRRGLIAAGVDCRGLKVDAGGSSQVAFIAVDHQGHRNIFWHRGTADPPIGTDIDDLLLRGARVLHLDGLPVEGSLAAARMARKRDVVTVLDGGTLRDGSRELLGLIDHPVVSEKFAEQLVQGASVGRKLEALLDFGGQAATITCGGEGSWSMARGGAPFHQPAFAADVVDTTGCGDVFHGGYIYGLLQGWELSRVVRFAAAAAALKTRRLGGRDAIPELSEVFRLSENQIKYIKTKLNLKKHK